MSAMFYLAIIGCIGLAVPVGMALFYPIYRLFGGELSFSEAVGGL